MCVCVCVCSKKIYMEKKDTSCGMCLLCLVEHRKNMKTKRAVDTDSEEEEEPKKSKKPKKKTKDLLVVFGSHEMVLTHHMNLPAGFTMKTDEVEALQIITPKRTKANELKSFRARLGRHLRAVGFTSIEDDENSWVRPTVDADGKNVALDKYTLKSPTDPAVRQQLELIDPFEGF